MLVWKYGDLWANDNKDKKKESPIFYFLLWLFVERRLLLVQNCDDGPSKVTRVTWIPIWLSRLWSHFKKSDLDYLWKWQRKWLEKIRIHLTCAVQTDLIWVTYEQKKIWRDLRITTDDKKCLLYFPVLTSQNICCEKGQWPLNVIIISILINCFSVLSTVTLPPGQSDLRALELSNKLRHPFLA